MMIRETFHELEPTRGTIVRLASLTGYSESTIRDHFYDLNDRMKEILGYDYDPIAQSSDGTIKFDGVCGLLRLNEAVEIEVVPKYLSPRSKIWRTDFLLLAILHKTGHLISSESISMQDSLRGDLVSLVAAVFMDGFERNARHIIRSYRSSAVSDFSLDGDVDWETTVLPSSDGFTISHISRDRANPFNSVFSCAASILLGEVEDVTLQSRLRHALRSLGSQRPIPDFYPPIPPRHDRWTYLYDLSQIIISGLGLNLDGGRFTGPGFILSTWSTWESLCEELVRQALPECIVEGQKRWKLGLRGSEDLYVKPDISPLCGKRPPFLLDAKYKTRHGRKPSIASTDIYESLAFLRASSTSSILLLYPASKDLETVTYGSWHMFDSISVDSLSIQGYEVQITGLSQRGGFDLLVESARRALMAHI